MLRFILNKLKAKEWVSLIFLHPPEIFQNNTFYFSSVIASCLIQPVLLNLSAKNNNNKKKISEDIC